MTDLESSRGFLQLELKFQQARQIITDGDIPAGHVESKKKISDLLMKHFDMEQSQFISPSPLWVATRLATWRSQAPSRSFKPIPPQRESVWCN